MNEAWTAKGCRVKLFRYLRDNEYREEIVIFPFDPAKAKKEDYERVTSRGLEDSSCYCDDNDHPYFGDNRGHSGGVHGGSNV
jgi:hypothetical protein